MLMGLEIVVPLDDPSDSLEGEARPQQTVFGSDTPRTNQVKTVVCASVLMAPTCFNRPEF